MRMGKKSMFEGRELLRKRSREEGEEGRGERAWRCCKRSRASSLAGRCGVLWLVNQGFEAEARTDQFGAVIEKTARNACLTLTSPHCSYVTIGISLLSPALPVGIEPAIAFLWQQHVQI